jgi:uncharacterized membrane protein YhhN
MFYACIPAYLLIIFTILYMITRNRNDLKHTAFIQPSLTFLALLVAGASFLSPSVNTSYTIWILVGLAICFITDLFRIDMENERILLAAIAVLVVAYLEYAITFTRFNGFQPEDWIFGAIFLIVYGCVMWLFWKKLGKFKIPVIVYGLALSFMTTRAISTLFGNRFSLVSAILVTGGTLLLLMGNVEYGMHRFKQPVKFFYGPLCYAFGQLLIALSCSYFNL